MFTRNWASRANSRCSDFWRRLRTLTRPGSEVWQPPSSDSGREFGNSRREAVVNRRMRIGAIAVVAVSMTLAGIGVRQLHSTVDDPYTTLGMVPLDGGIFVAGANDLLVSVHSPNAGLEPSSMQPFALREQQVQVAPFLIDRTEVTVQAYARCVEAQVCSKAEESFRCSAGSRLVDNPALPITCVHHAQAAGFCEWSGKRLPTELEWEFAARGVRARRYPWGNTFDAERLCSRQAEPCAVASHPAGATAEGVFDLAGNVWEWTSGDPARPFANRYVTFAPIGTWVFVVQRIRVSCLPD